MSTSEPSNRELVLAPGQQAYILDRTKGNISVYVGPTKTSLAETDLPVVYNPKTRRFDRTELLQAIQEFPQAPEGSYLVLENPAPANAQSPHPKLQASTMAIELQVGVKVNLRGPLSFPLWPGQNASVIEGHRLRSNQYLLVRVYNNLEAERNAEAVQFAMEPPPPTPIAKTPTTEGGQPPDTGSHVGDGSSESKSPPAGPESTPPPAGKELRFTVGQLIVIKGTDASFFIPPTGFEVIPQANGVFVREAVSLERLEYCMLLNESGEKRIEIGPKVVFPEPTEVFKETDGGSFKARAIELNEDMGLHIKVTEAYQEGGNTYAAGQELFITGKDMRIYYPRKEHAIIRYGTQDRHYGVMIPEGEGRYVLDKPKGKIELVRGPCILLPDPRTQVIVRRVLAENECGYLYPGNAAALEYNRGLRGRIEGARGEASLATSEDLAYGARLGSLRRGASEAIPGDEFQRGGTYNPPRTITLDSKFEGAVAVSPWTGYAIMVVKKSGESRVEQGPKTVLLGYDETLEVLELSTSKPKSTERLERTVYLKVRHNQVSDIVTVVTRDMVEVRLKVAYRVDFEGQDPRRWFSIKNYVKFLTDHARSVLRGAAKEIGVEELTALHVPFVRDTILGEANADEGRLGMKFENGMCISDVEVLGIEIGDATISNMLITAQTEAVRRALEVARLEHDIAIEGRKSEVEAARKKLKLEDISREQELELARLGAAAERLRKEAENRKLQATEEAHARSIRRGIEKDDQTQLAAFAQSEIDRELLRLAGEVKAVVEKAGAISPELVAAVQTLGNQLLVMEASGKMAPLAILGGGSVMDVLNRLLAGTGLEKAISSAASRQNGTSAERASSTSS